MCAIRPTSTKEVADALEIGVNTAWYHVDKLHQLGCIKEAFRKKRGGAEECFYEATCEHYFDADAWEEVPSSRRSGFVMRILRLISSDLDIAVKSKTLEAADSHLSRIPMDLDAKGRKEAYAVLGKAMKQLLAIRRRCVARTRGRDVETSRASFVFMQLDLAPRDES